MRRLLPVLCFWIAVGSQADAAPPILRFEDVRAGMRGSGRTVFQGQQVESFQLEIVGKLPNIGPDQNLILARLSGGPLEETGVLAGMSGSPVFVEDRLVGAVAYGWGFAKEALAGITPIEEMLALAGQQGGGRQRSGAAIGGTAALKPLASPELLRQFLDGLRSELVPTRGALPVSVPLAVSGIGARGLDRILPDFNRAGFRPVQAGGSGDSPVPAEPLQPGSAMGLKLIRGDVDMTATGTVTWIEGDTLLALGHPMFGLGSVDLPLTGARVETLLPSLQQSVRIATPLAEVGALREDRAAGVVGVLGATPRMIPVRLQLSGSSAESSFAFDIADDPLLSPLLLYYSLNGILASKERVFGSATVRLKRDSVIKLAGGQDVELDNLYAGPSAFDLGTGIAAYILYLLMNNTWTQPEILGVNLLLEYEDFPRTARIRRASLDRYRVTAGEAVEVSIVLSPYRGRDRVLRHKITVPPETPPGTITVSIGGALAISRAVDRDEPVLPRDLDQLIWLINQLRRNDRVHILATHEDSGVLLSGARLPNLPPSVASVLTRPRSEGNFTHIPRRAILEEIVPTEYAVEGAARIQLEVEVR